MIISLEILSQIIAFIALITCVFMFWRDATREGYSADKIFDTSIFIILGGFLGGKLLFRPLDFGYFRYQFLSSPLILEGLLVGGFLSLLYITRRYKWERWKVGDMLAPGLSLAQSLLFLSFWIYTNYLSMLVNSFLFLWLYAMLVYFKRNFHYGSSLNFFALKRLNVKLFSGGLFVIYLTGSSLIAMIFLLSHHALEDGFWWFQVVFYLLILIVSAFLYIKQLRIHEVDLGMFDKFIDKLTKKLNRRKAEITDDIQHLDEVDPFKQEYSDAAKRDSDEFGDDITELEGHSAVEAGRVVLEEEKSEIERTIDKLNKHNYGKCEKCGKDIDPKRLEVYPTARYCISCERKLEKVK